MRRLQCQAGWLMRRRVTGYELDPVAWSPRGFRGKEPRCRKHALPTDLCLAAGGVSQGSGEQAGAGDALVEVERRWHIGLRRRGVIEIAIFGRVEPELPGQHAHLFCTEVRPEQLASEVAQKAQRLNQQ